MKKLLSLMLTLTLSLSLCAPAIAAGEDGAPTVDDFMTHWDMEVNLPGVETVEIACNPFYLWDYHWEADGPITDGYEYKKYNAIEPGTTFTLTNTAPSDVDCQLSVNLTTYTLQDGQYTYAEEPGGYGLYSYGFQIADAIKDWDPRLVLPGESLTFDLSGEKSDGTPLTFGPDTILLLRVNAYYPDYDKSCWSKSVYRIDEAGVAKLRAESTGIAAKAGTSKVQMDGKPASFNAYVIEQANYIKLRDFAQLVSGTGKQFDVSWNGAKNAIELTSGKPYTAVGGELTPGNGADKAATVSTSAIYKDGAAIDLTVYTIDRNNYFKLRDLCAAFDIFVGWDDKTGTVSIDTAKGYVAE